MAAKGQAKSGGRVVGVPNAINKDIAMLAGIYTEEAIKTLVNVMQSSDKDASKVAAAIELLNRAHGKPHQSVAVNGDLGFADFIKQLAEKP